jgi:hypothetical protein
VRCRQSDGVGEKDPNRSTKVGFGALSVQAAITFAIASLVAMRPGRHGFGVVAWCSFDNGTLSPRGKSRFAATFAQMALA